MTQSILIYFGLSCTGHRPLLRRFRGQKSHRQRLGAVQILLLSLAFSGLSGFGGKTAHAQQDGACPAQRASACERRDYCVGMNTGFLHPASLERPFIDQMRSAALEVSGYRPIDILRNANIELDANKYPTAVGREILVQFFKNLTQTYAVEPMPNGPYVVLWSGGALNPKVRGKAASNVKVDTRRRRIEFDLDSSKKGRAWFRYENAPDRPHVRNIRIVPKEYEDAYANWSWNRYEVGAETNPPIFFPEWLEKMSAGCAIRYVNSNGTNDLHVVDYMRDSSLTRVNPSSSVWYEGFGLGRSADERHQWPWELMVEATIQTGTEPWLNFRVLSYENLIAGDPFIADVARLFHRYYGGPVFVEYGNEIWNEGFIFSVSTHHVRDNGPGINNDVNENYSLRNNAIQKAFADAYGDDGCLVRGVAASQGRNSWRGGQVLRHADKRYIDVLSPGLYVGDDMWPQSPVWNYVSSLIARVDAGELTRNGAFSELQEEVLTGSSGVIKRNWQNDIKVFAEQYVSLAEENGLCLSIYEMGLHMRVDGVDLQDSDQVGLMDFVHDYKRGREQAAIEKEMHEWIKSKSAEPTLLYGSMMKNGGHAFATWDSTFEPIEQWSPTASLIRYYKDARGPILQQLESVGKRLTGLKSRSFKSARAQKQLLAKYRTLRAAIDTGSKTEIRRRIRQFSVRVDGCGERADANDLLLNCTQQRRIQATIQAVGEAVQRQL